MAHITTLVNDIYSVLEGQGKEILGLGAEIEDIVKSKVKAETPRKPTLRMSNIGTNCLRKLWYTMKQPEGISTTQGSDRLRFMYGDLLESVILSLAESAGHKVEGRQDRVQVAGINGSRDAVIDGMLIDVKTASASAMGKFRNHSLETEDPFGYLWQLAGYLKAAQDDPLVTYKNVAGFLAIDKSTGDMVLDIYDLTEYINSIEDRIDEVRTAVVQPTPPDRVFEDEETSGGNRQLCFNCSFCEFKHECWPGLRVFKYAGYNGKPKYTYLTEVNKVPRVLEVTP